MKVILMLAGVALFGLFQGKENPVYKSWAEFKVGAWVKMRSVMMEQGEASEFDETVTLKEIGTERAVLEHIVVMKGTGPGIPMVFKEIVPTKDPDAAGAEQLGEEDVVIGARKIRCQVNLIKDPRERLKIKSWVAKEIPGGIARRESTREGADQPFATMSALDWGKK